MCCASNRLLEQVHFVNVHLLSFLKGSEKTGMEVEEKDQPAQDQEGTLLISFGRPGLCQCVVFAFFTYCDNLCSFRRMLA